MLPLYIHRNSAIHRIGAGAKLTLLFAVSLALSLQNNPALLTCILAGVIALFAAAKLPFQTVWNALKPALFMVVMFASLQAAIAGVNAALVTLLKVTGLILLASLVTVTTRFSDMAEFLSRAAKPLSLTGFSPAKFGLALALAIRFIPELMNAYAEIQAAREARGARRLSITAFGPLLIKVLRMVSDIGDALTARCFEEQDAPVKGKK
jgi:biotin transport system permease protein